MATLLLAGIAFGAVVLTAGLALAVFPSRSRTAVWLCIGIPYVMVVIASTVVSVVGFRDPQSGLGYINVPMRLIIMAYFVSGASAAALLLLLANRARNRRRGVGQ